MTFRVFVTGASGFVGQHLVRALSSEGHSVRALVHHSPVQAEETVRGSLEQPLADWLAGCDAVVHAGALLDPIHDEARAERVNHRGTVELAKVASKAGVKVFVFVSSQAALGFHPGAGLVAPDAPARPTTAYGRSKLEAERALRDLGALRTVVLRPPTVYGPGERRNFLALTRAIASGVFLLPGRGDNRLSFCAVENLCAAICWALRADSAQGILHVADEPVRPFRETCNLIAEAVGRRLLPIPFPLPLARSVALALELALKNPPLSRARLTTLTADCALDTSATQSAGFSPRVTMEQGVRRTVSWYREAGLLRTP